MARFKFPSDSRDSRSDKLPSHSPADIPLDGERGIGPVQLKPSQSPYAAFIFLLIFSVFWNGLVWWLLVPEVVQTWRAGAVVSSIGFTLFASIFVLVGLAVVVGAVYSFLAIFNPRATVTISRGSIELGHEAEVSWEFSSSYRAMKQVTVTLEGVEEARYRRGTNHYTDRHVFASRILFETSDSLQMQRGKATVAIPIDAMHSFTQRNNKIVWRLQVRGQVPRWPDVKQEFELRVLPRSVEGAGT